MPVCGRDHAMSERQIILDTETTGLDPKQGYRMIKVGCVELIDRKLTGNHFHHYLTGSLDRRRCRKGTWDYGCVPAG